MKAELWERFASRLKTVDETPEPLRAAAFAALKPDDEIRLLVFGPAQKVLGNISPATLLEILENEWLVVTGTEEITPELFRCAFADTLLVEITNIQLHGKLRLDFVAGGRAQTVVLEFNTVMEGLYQEAVQLLLNGMDGISEITPCDSKKLHHSLESLPMKFFNATAQFIPMRQRVLALVHWPAVLGEKRLCWRHEITPEAMLALTDRELLFISEEKTSSWARPDRVPKYGSIVTHCPLSRVAAVQMSEHDLLDTIDVEIRVRGAGEKLKIDFPHEQKHRWVNGFERPDEIYK
jgi:hypothetical protein